MSSYEPTKSISFSYGKTAFETKNCHLPGVPMTSFETLFTTPRQFLSSVSGYFSQSHYHSNSCHGTESWGYLFYYSKPLAPPCSAPNGRHISLTCIVHELSSRLFTHTSRCTLRHLAFFITINPDFARRYLAKQHLLYSRTSCRLTWNTIAKSMLDL